MPPPRLTSERFVPYTSSLPQSAVNASMVKLEAGAAASENAEPISRLPSQNVGELVTTGTKPLLDNMQPAVEDRVPYAWVNEYSHEHVCSLSGTIGPMNMPAADRKDILKTLEAAKATILDLSTEDQKKEFNLDDVPVGYTGLQKIARELDLIIPILFIPASPGILPMDRMLRAAQSYIDRLRRKQARRQNNTAQPEIPTAPDHQVASGSKPSDKAVKKIKNGTSSKPGKEYIKGKKVKGKKEQKKKRKARSSGNKKSAPTNHNKRDDSKKRKNETDHDKEQLVDNSSQKKRKKLSASAIEEEVLQLEIAEPVAKKVKKEKQPKIQCHSTEKNYPPLDNDDPEPTTEKRKKKKKEPSIPEETKSSEILSQEPSRKKKKAMKAKKESTPVDEKPSQDIPEPDFDGDASFIREALEQTEKKNHNLSQEIHNLRAILQAVGVTGARLSVALTRMRHGQSAQEIFAGIKREES